MLERVSVYVHGDREAHVFAYAPTLFERPYMVRFTSYHALPPWMKEAIAVLDLVECDRTIPYIGYRTKVRSHLSSDTNAYYIVCPPGIVCYEEEGDV